MFWKTFLCFLMILIMTMASAAFAGKVELTTYYPSPYGEYTNLKSTGDSYFATDSGSVGIGTTSASAKLVVRGSATHLSNGAGATATFANTSSANTDYLTIGWTGEDSWVINSADASTYRNLNLQPFGGTVGIGTTAPPAWAKLNVKGFTLLTGLNATVNTGGGATSAVDVRYAGGGTEYGMDFLPQADGACALYFNNAAGNNIGSIGNTAGATTYNTSSDKRLKENVVDSKLGLDALKRISVKEFNFIADPQKKVTQGLLAQDLYEIYPYAVTTGGDDPKKHPWSIDYGRLTPLIVKSVQEQQKEIDDLKSELKTQIELLKKEIAELKKR